MKLVSDTLRLPSAAGAADKAQLFDAQSYEVEDLK
jgi:hypothetical protein